MLRRFRSFVRRLLVVRLLLVQAFVMRALGRKRSARATLRKVVCMAPMSFNAHFNLGTLLLKEGQNGEALREFGICHRLEPARFFTRRLPVDIMELVYWRADAATLTGDPADPGSKTRSPQPRPDQREERRVQPILKQDREDDGVDQIDDTIEFDEALAEDALPLLHSDFSSAEEFLRFNDLPPISKDDLRKVNVEHLLRRLLADKSPGGASQNVD